MTVTEDDLRAIRERVAPLLGQRSWDARLGVGSFITLEFGEAREPAGKRAHGEWHLWVHCCAWRLDDGDEVVAAPEDARDILEQAVARLDDRVLERVEVTGPALETVWWFERRLALRLFPISPATSSTGCSTCPAATSSAQALERAGRSHQATSLVRLSSMKIWPSGRSR